MCCACNTCGLRPGGGDSSAMPGEEGAESGLSGESGARADGGSGAVESGGEGAGAGAEDASTSAPLTVACARASS